MRRGPKLEPIILTTEENNRLVEWTRRHKTSQALAMRARIVDQILESIKRFCMRTSESGH